MYTRINEAVPQDHALPQDRKMYRRFEDIL